MIFLGKYQKPFLIDIVIDRCRWVLGTAHLVCLSILEVELQETSFVVLCELGLGQKQENPRSQDNVYFGCSCQLVGSIHGVTCKSCLK